MREKSAACHRESVGQTWRQLGCAWLQGMPEPLAHMQKMTFSYVLKLDMKRREHWLLRQHDTIFGGLPRLADCAMAVVMMAMAALFMENGLPRVAVMAVFCHAQTVLRTFNFHIMLMHERKKPCEDVAQRQQNMAHLQWHSCLFSSGYLHTACQFAVFNIIVFYTFAT